MNKFIPVIIAYICALLVAGIFVVVLPFGLVPRTLIADIAATVVIFMFSRAFKNSSFYDAFWSLAPIAIAAYWLCHAHADANMTRGFLVLGLITWWGVRLTLNWASHWPDITHEDWRYPPIREKAGKYAALADFGSIHLFPTLIVFLACLPIFAVTEYGSRPLYWLDYLALFVTASAILIETTADVQLHKFVKTKTPGSFIKTGLWAYSRHPNYFGEFGFWAGLALFGLAAHPSGWWWILPGVTLIGLMFIFISIPMMDKRSLASREGYGEHMKSVSAFVPWPKK